MREREKESVNFGEEYNGFVWGLGMTGFGRESRETGVNSGGFFFFFMSENKRV